MSLVTAKVGSNKFFSPEQITAGILILVGLAAFGLQPMAQVLVDPPDPSSCQPYGDVYYRGALAPESTLVVATIDNTEYSRTYTHLGKYLLIIPKDNPQTSRKDGWQEGDLIVMKVNGIVAYPQLTAAGGAHLHNISVSTSSVELTTWGKIKALFK